MDGKKQPTVIFSNKLNIKTISEVTNEHWAVKSKRHKTQKNYLKIWWLSNELDKKIKIPCTIKFTRVSPRELDYDNLPSSFKYIRDAIADFIFPGKMPGQADSNKNLSWEYYQEKGNPKEYAIKIEISTFF